MRELFFKAANSNGREVRRPILFIHIATAGAEPTERETEIAERMFFPCFGVKEEDIINEPLMEEAARKRLYRRVAVRDEGRYDGCADKTIRNWAKRYFNGRGDPTTSWKRTLMDTLESASGCDILRSRGDLEIIRHNTQDPQILRLVEKRLGLNQKPD
ncbi:MAG: hypothetical protein U0R44_01615 [Candidatus Micrarchaeia archaeon]